MKKYLFASLLLATLSIGGLQAQNENAAPQEGTTHTTNGGSTAKTKGVGKGTPLLQRQSGGTTTVSPAEDAAPTNSKSGAVAPGAPAPAATPAKPKEAPQAAPNGKVATQNQQLAPAKETTPKE